MTMNRTLSTVVVILGATFWLALPAGAQQGRGAPPAPVSPRAGARVDLTGYWVSEVTEYWRVRRSTP